MISIIPLIAAYRVSFNFIASDGEKLKNNVIQKWRIYYKGKSTLKRFGFN